MHELICFLDFAHIDCHIACLCVCVRERERERERVRERAREREREREERKKEGKKKIFVVQRSRKDWRWHQVRQLLLGLVQLTTTRFSSTNCYEV